MERKERQAWVRKILGRVYGSLMCLVILGSILTKIFVKLNDGQTLTLFGCATIAVVAIALLKFATDAITEQ